jgi:SAM-dependent methyltransferase
MEKPRTSRFAESERTKPRVAPFNRHTRKYEAWFTRNKYAYLSELRALRMLHAKGGIGVEIGIGSGRFAKPLGINIGIEPSSAMRNIAHKKGIDVIDGIAESLPIASSKLDSALMVTTICFVVDLEASLREVHRILKPTGRLVLGFVDGKSFLGPVYERRKSGSVFYSVADFYSTDELVCLLTAAGFSKFELRQTIFHDLQAIRKVETIKKGHGEGAFVVLAASKNQEVN